MRQGLLVRTHYHEVPHRLDMNRHLILPLRTQDRVIGLLYIRMDLRHRLLKQSLNLLTAIADIAGSGLYRAIMVETLEQRVQRRTQELAQANERLQQLDRLRAKFVSDMSHELRTPVTNFRLYLELLESGRIEKRLHYLGVLKHETHRLERLIDETLNLSRIDFGKDEIILMRLI